MLHEDPLNNSGADYVHPERPERIRAVKLGLAAVCARLEAGFTKSQRHALSPSFTTSALTIARTSASVDILNSDLVRFVHGSLVDQLVRYCKQGLSSDTWAGRHRKAKNGEMYDLYREADKFLYEPSSRSSLTYLPVAAKSMEAMNGAVGATLEAVDSVCKSAKDSHTDALRPAARAFVVVRPPGHHCDRVSVQSAW